MLKEFLIYLKITWATDRENYLKYKLSKHQCKMTDIHEKYKDFKFKNHAAKNEFNYLHSEIMNRWYGDVKEED